MPGRIRSFMRAFLRRGRFEDGMADELRFHIDAYAADLRRSGVPTDEASRKARAAFGGIDGVREDCRQARGLQFVDRLWQDLHYSLRLMKHTPAFTAAAIISLGLGIGANTAVFSLIDAVLLRSLAVPNPHELYFLAHGDGEQPSTSSNYPLFDRYRTTQAFSGVTAFRGTTFKVSVDESVELVPGQFVSGNYHAVIGAPLLLGRGFASESDRPSAESGVAVISEGYWARRFGRASDVLGRPLTVQGHRVVIVGVTAAAFGGFTPGSRVDITLPLALYVLSNPGYLDGLAGFTSMPIVARLAAGVSEAQALAAADVQFQQFMSQPEVRWARDQSPEGYTVARLQPARQGSHGLRRQYRTPLFVLMGMAALVLIVASANIANLLLARSSARAREVAIRLCVGSGRWRVVRQFLTESAVLALAGGALGVLLAFWGTDLIVAMFSNWRQSLVLDVSPNLRVLAFAGVVTITTGMAFGVGPALKATSGDLTPMLNGNERGTGVRLRASVVSRGIIVAQVALCVVVVAMAALLGQSVHNLKARDAGFEVANVLLFDVDTFSSQPTRAELEHLHAGVLEQMTGLPGVTAASISTMTPIHTSGSFRGLALPGLPETPDARGVWSNAVSADYFRTLGVRVLRGRAFDDVPGAKSVGVLNERTARHIFGDADPIGQTVAWMSTARPAFEVIGVVEDTSLENLRDDAPHMVYTPMADEPDLPNRVQVAVKTTGDPRILAGSVRDLVRRVNRAVVVDSIRTMDEQVDASLVRERGLTWLSAAFAVLTSILACVGLYGVLSYDVARRTREIGIRLALGARPGSVLGGVLRHTMRLTLAGVVLGIACALVATRVISTFLYGLSERDPLTLAAVSAALVLTALVAGYLPARRAARIDPLRAIRTE